MCEGLVRPNRYPPKVFPNTKLSLVLEQKHFRKHFVKTRTFAKVFLSYFFHTQKVSEILVVKARKGTCLFRLYSR